MQNPSSDCYINLIQANALMNSIVACMVWVPEALAVPTQKLASLQLLAVFPDDLKTTTDFYTFLQKISAKKVVNLLANRKWQKATVKPFGQMPDKKC